MYFPILVIVMKLFYQAYPEVYDQVRLKLVCFFLTFIALKALRITLYYEICYVRDSIFVKWAKFILFMSEMVISSIILAIGLKNME